jgi:hypothetical protein
VRGLCAIPLISPLFAEVLCFETASLTPSGVLHIVTFLTLCKAYMGIEPHFNLWSHFFRAHLLLGSVAEAAVLGGVDVYVKSGNGFDP